MVAFCWVFWRVVLFDFFCLFWVGFLFGGVVVVFIVFSNYNYLLVSFCITEK